MTKHCAALQREGNKKVTGGRRSADHDDHDNDNLSCDESALKGQEYNDYSRDECLQKLLLPTFDSF